MFLSLRLPQPLLLEGEAGVGKTEAAKALARGPRHAAGAPAVLRGDRRRRGAVRVELPPPAAVDPAGRCARRASCARSDLFGPDYLTARPLLRALQHPGPRPAVLLIDEIDRADDDFEAFLLELLAEAAVTIPELGTIRATHPPVIVLDLQPHPRPARRRQAPLPVSVDRLPERRARGGDHPPPGQGGRRPRWPSRSPTPSRGCATPTCRSRRGSPRRSTGWPRSTCSAWSELDEPAIERTLGSVLKYREDQDVIRAAGLADAPGGSG